MYRTGAAVAIAALLGSGASVSAQSIAYTAHTFAGDTMRIGAGQPATLVAVFATWCTTCRHEFGTLDSLRTALAPRGIRVLALSVDERDDASVRKYAEARKTRVPVARDASGAVGKTFGTVGVPETYLIDTKGVIRWRGRGELRSGLAELRRVLGELRL